MTACHNSRCFTYLNVAYKRDIPGPWSSPWGITVDGDDNLMVGKIDQKRNVSGKRNQWEEKHLKKLIQFE